MEKKSGYQKERPNQVLFICAITYQDQNLFNKALEKLETLYGEIDSVSDDLDFSSFTTFYHQEMGENLKKRLICFKNLRLLEDLHLTKVQTIQLEKELSYQSKRQVNLDPGYITLSKVVLFSSKDFFHRIYIGDNIFAEVTLLFSKKTQSFKGFDYTYIDFIQDKFVHFLNKQRYLLRTIYRK